MMQSNRASKLGLTLLTAVASAMLLTGCTQSAPAEVKNVPHQIIETSYSLTEGSAWSYINQNSEEIPLNINCSEDGLSGCFTNEDGSVKLNYFENKRGITSESMILDGVELSIKCERKTVEEWSGYVCTPTD